MTANGDHGAISVVQAQYVKAGSPASSATLGARERNGEPIRCKAAQTTVLTTSAPMPNLLSFITELKLKRLVSDLSVMSPVGDWTATCL